MTTQYMGKASPKRRFSCLQPAVEIVVDPDHVVAVGHQVVGEQPQLEAATVSTTKTSPDTECGQLTDEAPADLLQGELAQCGEEQPQAVDESYCENHEGDQVDEGNGH